jgi:hypothetical protein
MRSTEGHSDICLSPLKFSAYPKVGLRTYFQKGPALFQEARKNLDKQALLSNPSLLLTITRSYLLLFNPTSTGLSFFPKPKHKNTVFPSVFVFISEGS